MAVHPDDIRKLPLVFQTAISSGYIPVQVLNYSVNAYYFVFFWFEGEAACAMAVDIVFDHRRGGLITPGESLVSGRLRNGVFWIPSPETEFTYLLAKKSWKGTASSQQLARLRKLVELLGYSASVRLARSLFIGDVPKRVIDACGTGQIQTLLPQLKVHTWLSGAWHNPVSFTMRLVADVYRRAQRWMQPTGLFVVFFGPDGVGKTTALNNVVAALSPAFRRHRVFHLRPSILCGGKVAGSCTSPHSRPPYNAFVSICKLVLYAADYWLGYCARIRPLLAKSGLVVFDRYFDDLLIDPRRYRYGGPQWLVRIVAHFLPRPNVVLLMDAPAHTVLTRKQELPLEEVQRQRQAYCDYQRVNTNRYIVDANLDVAGAAADAAHIITEFLAGRFRRRHKQWLKHGSSGVAES